MADVNPPPSQQLPRQFFEDPEVRKYMEALQFNVFQLWKRTGGGQDLIQETITNNITNTGVLSNADGRISRLTKRVSELENNEAGTRNAAQIRQTNRRIDELIDLLLAELKLLRPDRELEQQQAEDIEEMRNQFRLLNMRNEQLLNTGIELDEVDQE